MTRRNVKPEPNILVRAPLRQHWPPACPAGCGFIGEPNDRQSPWIACTVNGETDPGRHQRRPVGMAVTA